MKKITILNLQYDWEGICDWWGVSEAGKKEIKRAVAFEVDCFRNQSWWRRLFNKYPKWKMLED